MLIYLCAFLVGGAICALGQIILLLFKLSTGHITILFVILGIILSINGFYDKLVEVSGAGAFLPITSFGASLAEASYEGLVNDGFIGLFTNMYSKTSGGIALVLILSVFIALIFKPKS